MKPKIEIRKRWPTPGASRLLILTRQLGDQSALLSWLVVSSLLVTHMIPFAHGFRTTADEVGLLNFLFDGWEMIWRVTISLALHEGRVSMFFHAPIDTLTSYLSDSYAWRFVFVLAYFTIFILFSIYVSVLLKANVARALLLVLISINPLSPEFMPPIAYPLEITLPIILILCCRCAALLQRSHATISTPTWRPLTSFPFALAMLASEYAFLFGTALLLAEWFGTFLERRRATASSWNAIVQIFRLRPFRIDLAIATGVVGITSIFRWINPSHYDGASMDAIGRIGRVIETSIRHIFAGTIFPRLAMSAFSVPSTVLLMAFTVGVLTAFCLSSCVKQVGKLPAPLVTGGTAGILMLYVSIPIAAASKYQAWCVDHGTCGYVDSRMSYLGFGVVVLCLLSFAFQQLSARAWRTCLNTAASIGIGLISSATYAENWQTGQHMAADALAWRRADLLACHPQERPESDEEIGRFIDPQKRISFHPDLPPSTFWHRYFDWKQSNGDCSQNTDILGRETEEIALFGPSLVPGQIVQFSSLKGELFLSVGWSQPEAWGVWSDGDYAELNIQPRQISEKSKSYLRIKFVPYLGPSVTTQTFRVTVDGEPTDLWTFTDTDLHNGCCEKMLVLPAEQRKSIKIGFQIDHPRNPEFEIGSTETRRLGIGLIEMSLAK